MKNLNHHHYSSLVILLLSFSVHSCHQPHLNAQDGETLPNKTGKKTSVVAGTLSTPTTDLITSLEHLETNMGIESNDEMPHSGTASKLPSRKRPVEALYHDTEEKKESPTALTQPSVSRAISVPSIHNMAQDLQKSDEMTVSPVHTVARLTMTEQKDTVVTQEDTKKSTKDAEVSEDLEHWFKEFVEAVDDKVVLYQGETSRAIPALVQEGRKKGYLTKSRKLSIEVDWEPDCTPLHYAAAKGNSQAVDVLLKESDVAIDARTEDNGTTPLQFAAHGGHLASVRLLIDAYKTKEKISEIDTRDNQNTSTLQYAALGIQEDMNREVAELLVKAGADPLQMDGDISLMDMAAVAGNSAMIEYCMEKVFNHKNEKPIILSAIKIAKRKGHTHIAVMLQSRYEALQSNS